MKNYYFTFFLIFLVLQRLSELWLNKQNEGWLKEQGAQEFGREHYHWIVILMILFFIALPFEYFYLQRPIPSYWPYLLFGIILTQGLRYWSITSLGKRWSTRIWVIPNAPRVTTGPYRFIKHPNYLAVTLEMILIPWIFGCYYTMTSFTLFYLLWLRVRVKNEIISN